MRPCMAMAGLVIGLCACSVTVPVRGQSEDGGETFTGTTTGHMGGSGDLSIVTSRGTSCTGDFVYTTMREGEGVFRCADGRSGPFRFVSAGQHGTGEGRLGGERFTFTFGN